jgi:lysophospholipase L1-like esterase
MQLKAHSRLLFIGDSITDVGRAHPFGEHGDALGKGYVSLVAAHLGAVYPEANIRITNVGSSGNTARNLKERWQRDVFDLKPDYVSIMIGINDVWRHFDRPWQTENLVSIEEYEQTLDELVRTTLPTVSGIVLMTPFYIEPNCAEPMRARMDQYGAVVKRLAEKYATTFVDTQAAFNAVCPHVYPGALAWDRVHPNLTGHNIIARAFLKGIEAL